MEKQQCFCRDVLLCRTVFALAFSFFAVLTPSVAKAQTFVKTYRMQEALKQYSVIALEEEDEYLMAGTMNNRYIHFMRTDGAGNVLDSWTYGSNSEQRATRIVAMDADRNFIVGLYRSVVGSGSRDRIRLIEVNKTGGVFSNYVIGSTLPAGANNYVNMYPLNTLPDPDNNLLYICGYVTKEPSTFPNYPQFTANNDKKAFVLRIDLNSMTTVCSTYDYVYTGVPATLPQPSTDFDMGMAMRLVNGNLYLTGAGNFVTASLGNPGVPSYRCGTMNLQLDPTTLSMLNANADAVFADISVSQGAEYGMDIVPDDANGSGYFVIGNTNALNSSPGIGFQAKQGMVICTRIDNSFTPTVSPMVARLFLKDVRSATALQTLRGTGATNNILIAGMQSGFSVCPATVTPDPSDDNFNPFLQDFTPSWNTSTNTIGYTTSFWRTYLTMFGTGIATNPNSYFRYGNGLSLFTWSPFLANRRSDSNPLGDEDVVLTAPSWNQNFNVLNIKLIRAQSDGKIPNCEEAYMSCQPGYGTSSVKKSTFTFGGNTITTPVTLASYGVSMTLVNPAAEPRDPYEIWDCEEMGLFRSAPEQPAAALVATVHPNPADKYVQIGFTGELQAEDQIDILLTDVTGKMSVSLYNGVAGNYSNDARLQLPQLAGGMYFVRISVNGRMLPVQKLIVQ